VAAPGVKSLRERISGLAEAVDQDAGTDIPVFAFYDTDRAVFDVPEAVRTALGAAFEEFAGLQEIERDKAVRTLAEHLLLPDTNGALQPFFTTARSLFGPFAESILARPPQAWI
jgi:hypothetical protein